MKKLGFSLVLALLSSAAAGSAQSPKNTEPQKATQATPSARTVTVTGCVGASADGTGYMLNEAIMAPRPIDSNASGDRVAAPSGDKMVVSYVLEGGDMKRHLGHKVEITASVAVENTMAMDHKDVAGTLKVKTVKTIASACS